MGKTSLTYLNKLEIDLYYKLFDLKEHVISPSKFGAELTLFEGIKISQEFERKDKNHHVIDKLYSLMDFLHQNDLLTSIRPNTIHEAKASSAEFIFEDIIADKLVFPKSKLSEIHGLNQLVIWLAEPDCARLSNEDWQFTGTFLYLIETSHDDERFSTTLSGCSALQTISNIVSGQPFYTTDWDEPLGRYNSQHPLEKLKSIGALYLQKQRIRTLYRRRYMTNEQAFMYKGDEYRCNDLLGYPLYIS